jgi:ribonuclease HI
MPEIIIYADGACKGTKIGGWGVFLQYGEHTKELFGGRKDTTNNQMELQAAIEAIKALKKPCSATVFTDSEYVVKGITQWIHGWKKSGRFDCGGVKNPTWWQELYELNYLSGHKITWKWVKGHAGHFGNEKADELANKGCVSAGHVVK